MKMRLDWELNGYDMKLLDPGPGNEADGMNLI
jgi:hypothetical protein